MKPSDSLKAFRALLKKHALPEQRLTGAEALSMMVEFFAAERAVGCDPTQQQRDMLLYQWGVFDWGDGPSFQFDITRQFIVGEGEDDEISQLRFTLHYPVSDEVKALGSGDRWCQSLTQLDDFQNFIRNSTAYRFSAHRRSDRIEIDYNCAG